LALVAIGLCGEHKELGGQKAGSDIRSCGSIWVGRHVARLDFRLMIQIHVTHCAHYGCRKAEIYLTIHVIFPFSTRHTLLGAGKISLLRSHTSCHFVGQWTN